MRVAEFIVPQFGLAALLSSAVSSGFSKSTSPLTYSFLDFLLTNYFVCRLAAFIMSAV